MQNNPPNIREPNYDRGLPVYPPLIQVCRVTAVLVSPPSRGSSSSGAPGAVIYAAFTEQVDPLTLTARDREACLVVDLSSVGMPPGYYNCRLVGNYLGLPLYSASCCDSVQGGPFVSQNTNSIGAGQPTITIYGGGFDLTPGSNVVKLYQNGVLVGTTTATTVNGTGTQLTILNPGGLTPGVPLTATVISRGVSTGTPITIGNVVPQTMVTLNTGSQDVGTSTLTINGSGFDWTNPANNTVTFNNGVTGTVTGVNAAGTQLTVSLSSNTIGDLAAVVTSYGSISGSPVEVAQITGSLPAFTTNTNWTATYTGFIRIDATAGSGKSTKGTGSGGGGGAGGDFIRKNAYPIVAGVVYGIKVGNVGGELGSYFQDNTNNNAINGADAVGPTGGVAGPSASSLGDTVKGGGSGGSGSAASGGGGGGEAADLTSNGANGANGTIPNGGAGGTGNPGADGGAGGIVGSVGVAGTAPGGAPGGSGTGQASVTAASIGSVIITRV